jgi:hypothetical protein
MEMGIRCTVVEWWWCYRMGFGNNGVVLYSNREIAEFQGGIACFRDLMGMFQKYTTTLL